MSQSREIFRSASSALAFNQHLSLAGYIARNLFAQNYLQKPSLFRSNSRSRSVSCARSVGSDDRKHVIRCVAMDIAHGTMVQTEISLASGRAPCLPAVIWNQLRAEPIRFHVRDKDIK
ncbi:MAG: hypothetical protein DMG70_10690 [Acidobacteria bacterium]|nr:MAG: hypothetical protein DMG70_10690 [Acidobacteriota bacterium]